MSRSNPVGAVAALLAICVLVLSPNTAAAQEFVLQFHDGLVTLVARDVSVRTILSQWGRTGSATVVNGEKVDGPPVTLQLVDVPERDALAILLRNAGGYLLAARHDFQPGASVFDRIVVVAPSAVRNASPQLAAQLSPPPATFESVDDPGIANQSAEPIIEPPPNAARSGAAPFAFGAPGPAPFAAQGNPGGPAGAPMGTSAGTARPGEVTTPPPVSRKSDGPQRAHQQQQQ
jgi:hypothetical protein